MAELDSDFYERTHRMAAVVANAIDWRLVGCGCQLDAAKRPFVDHCVCPDNQPPAAVLDKPVPEA